MTMTTTTAHFDGDTIEAATWPANERGLHSDMSARRGSTGNLRVRVPDGVSYRPPDGFSIVRVNHTRHSGAYVYVERED